MSFLVSNAFNGITGILVGVAPNYASLLVFRMLNGVGVKGGWMAGYVLSTDANARFSGALSLMLQLFLSHGDRRGGVQTHGRSPLSDVLQHRHPHPRSAGLLHRRLALAAGGHHRPLLHLPVLLLVRKPWFGPGR